MAHFHASLALHRSCLWFLLSPTLCLCWQTCHCRAIDTQIKEICHLFLGSLEYFWKPWVIKLGISDFYETQVSAVYLLPYMVCSFLDGDGPQDCGNCVAIASCVWLLFFSHDGRATGAQKWNAVVVIAMLLLWISSSTISYRPINSYQSCSDH